MRKICMVLLTVFIFQASVEAADKLRIGLVDLSAVYMPLPLGEKRGFFGEQGLQAEFIRIRPTAALAALVSGEIDYWTTVPVAVAGAIPGLPIKVVACYVPGSPVALIARPEFKSVQELKGKTIGINTLGGALEVQARLIFKHFGLDPDKEIKFLASGQTTDARFAAMQQGLTAATVGSPPSDFFGKKMGFVVLATAHELFSYPSSGLVASVKKIKERPDEVKRVIKIGIKANRYIRENREGAVQFIMEWLKTDKGVAAATYDSVAKAFNDDGSIPENGLRLEIEERKKSAKVSREVSISDVADLTILREAQREFGIKGK